MDKLIVAAAAAICAAAAFAKDFDPRTFGAKGDGKTKDTAAIQKAVDACSAAGGGEVRFAGGKFLTGMFFLKDGVTLRIDADATILGSPDCADYPTNVPLRHLVSERCPRGRATALIVADECRNVGIVGRGRIDCNGDSFVELARTREYGYTSNGSQVGEEVPGGLGDNWVNWKYRRKPGNSPPRMVLFAGCADVLVEDVSIVNPAGGWGYWVTDCDRVVFDRAKVLANPVIPNNDGFHINCSRDVTIANCRVVAGDDGIKIRANSSALRHGRNRATERVVVSNCQIQSHAGALSFCWLGDGVIRDCTFSNIVCTDSAYGISFAFPKFEQGMTDFGDEETLVENLSFGNIILDRIYATPISIDVADDPMARFKGFRNVLFSNVRARALGFPSLRGRKSNPLENVVFSNCSFTKCAPERFPEKYQQKGAAYWFDPSKPQSFAGVKGVRFDGCVFETQDEAPLEVLAEADYAAAVRPIGVDGQAPWNGQAIWFMYPPTFGFTNRADAADYRFAVTDERGGVRTFEAASANASLAPVWRDLPVGWAKVTCVARAADGRELGAVGERSFWRQAPYRPGAYPRSGRSYAETSKSIGRFVMDLPIVRRLYLEGTPVPAAMVNPSNQVFISYPTKMGASVIRAMASLAASDPSSREEALRLASGVVRKLAAITEPEGRPLAGFPRTYEAHPGLSGHPAKMVERNGGKVMLMYPVEAGEAYLDLYAVTQDAALRSAVIRIADRYLELQGADGTWPLNCWLKDGKSVEANRLVPVFLMEFLERVHKLTGEAKYRAAADRAFAYVEKGPLATWNWEGQFEDVVPTAPFQNLTKHNACDTALYLTRRYPRDAKRIARARELLRFSEDQFVCWERPCHGVGDDPRGRRKLWGVESWRCPAVLEQYNCYVPIDASAAKLIRTYLALYAVERNPLDLAKARTLGDAIVRETRGGYCPTFWFDFCEDWPNCMLASALALGELETHGGALCR